MARKIIWVADMQIQVVLVFSDLFHSLVEEIYIFGLATLQLNYQRLQTNNFEHVFN